MIQSIITNSAQETIAWARDFAKILKPGDVVCLRGDLGTGKTTLVKGIAEGLGLSAAEHVTSPTFVIMHRYACRIPLYHFDCYRIKSPEDLIAVGFEDFIHSGEGVTCIEWPEKAGDLIPKGAIALVMTNRGKNLREILVRKG